MVKAKQPAVTEDMLTKMRRIYRLSQKAPNPGLAYRNLEHIEALIVSLLQELDPDFLTEEQEEAEAAKKAAAKLNGTFRVGPEKTAHKDHGSDHAKDHDKDGHKDSH